MIFSLPNDEILLYHRCFPTEAHLQNQSHQATHPNPALTTIKIYAQIPSVNEIPETRTSSRPKNNSGSRPNRPQPARDRPLRNTMAGIQRVMAAASPQRRRALLLKTKTPMGIVQRRSKVTL